MFTFWVKIAVTLSIQEVSHATILMSSINYCRTVSDKLVWLMLPVLSVLILRCLAELLRHKDVLILVRA